MQAERDALRDYVSARINAEARKHGDEIEFCDLRWGINTSEMEEEESSRKVLNVCFREIDRCETPFIILLGYRYGWIPDSGTVQNAADEVKMELDQLEKSVTALEIEYGSVLKQKKTLVYERVIVNEDYPEIYHSEDPEHREKLEELKQRIRNLTDSKIGTYEVHFRKGKPVQEDIRRFSDMVCDDLKELMKPEWDRYDALPQVQKKQMAAWNYIREKGKLFTARMHDAEKCLELLEKGSDQVLVCMGDPGSGKSTLASHIALALKERAQVLAVIGGLTPEDTDSFVIIRKSVEFLENLLDKHCDDIREETGEPDEYKAYAVRMRELADLLPAETVLYIIVDALDQFNDSRYRDRLGFIPEDLPHNIRYFITCTKDLRLPETAVYVPEGLSMQDRNRIIDSVLERAGKELHGTVKDEIIQMKGSDQPLYISLMMQRLMIMNRSDFNAIDSAGLEPNEAIAAQQKKIIHASSENLSELAAQVLTDVGRRINPALCTQILQFIAVSRYGLRPSDLALLCKENWEAADFTLLIHSLADDFIVRDDGRYDFMHQSIRTGIRNTLNKTALISVDQKILKMLQSLPQDDPVRQSELIYHALRCRSFSHIFNYMNYRVDHEDTAYCKAVQAVYDFMIDYGAENVRALVAQTKPDLKYFGTLLMLSEGVPRLFDGESSSCSMMCDVLIDIYNTVSRMNLNSRNVKNEVLGYCAANIAKLGEWAGRTGDCKTYTSKYLKYAKRKLDQDDMHERIRLLHAYYDAMQSGRESADEEELAEAVRIGEEGLRLFDEKTDNQLLEDNNRLYAVYDYILTYICGRAKEPLKEAEAMNRFKARSEELYRKHPTKLNAYTRDLVRRSAMNSMMLAMAGTNPTFEQVTEAFRKVYDESLKNVKALEAADLNDFPTPLSELILDYEHLATCMELFGARQGRSDTAGEMIAWNVKAIDAGLKQVRKTNSRKDLAVLSDNLNSLSRRLAANKDLFAGTEENYVRWQNDNMQQLKINPSQINYEIAAGVTQAYAGILCFMGNSPKAADVIRNSLDDLQKGAGLYPVLIHTVNAVYNVYYKAEPVNSEIYDSWLAFSEKYGPKGVMSAEDILGAAFENFKNAEDTAGKAKALRYGIRLLDLKKAELKAKKDMEESEYVIRLEMKMADIIETLDPFHPQRTEYILDAARLEKEYRAQLKLPEGFKNYIETQKTRIPDAPTAAYRDFRKFSRLIEKGNPEGTNKLIEYLNYNQVYVPADSSGPVKEVFTSPLELMSALQEIPDNLSYDTVMLGDIAETSDDVQMILDPQTDHPIALGNNLLQILRMKREEQLKQPSGELKEKMIQAVREVINARQYAGIFLPDRLFLRMVLRLTKRMIRGEHLKDEEVLAINGFRVLSQDSDLKYFVIFTFRGMYLTCWNDKLIRYDEILKVERKEDEVWLYHRDHTVITIKTGRITESVYEILQAIIRTINGSQSV